MDGTAEQTDGTRRRRRRPRPIGLLAGAAGAALAAGAVVAVGSANPAGPVPGRIRLVQQPLLTGFRDCAALLAYERGHAAKLVGPYGLPFEPGAPGLPMRASGTAAGGAVPDMAVSAPAPEAAAAGAGRSDTASTSVTGTNVQVVGVDEADRAKLAGGRLLALTNGVLRVTDVSGGTPRPLGSLTLQGWSPVDLMVDGDTVLLFGPMEVVYPVDAPTGTPELAPEVLPVPQAPRSRVAQVSLADPAHPRLVRTLDVTGRLAGIRSVGHMLRFAVSTSPSGFRWRYPQQPGAERAALAANRRAVAAAGVDTWLPQYTLTRYGSGGSAIGQATRGRLLDCGQVSAPADFSGLGTLALVSVDLGDQAGIGHWSAAGVAAAGSTMYATAEHTYLATSRLPDGADGLRPGAIRTTVHEFADRGAGTSYLGSGTVPGTLLDQFSMDEYAGDLRVATTTEGTPETKPELQSGPAAEASPAPSRPVQLSESRVTVLRRDGNQLVVTGSVGGLGRGEQIRSVRFIGALGYVVTFRQTDPLYTLDLTDPAHPAVAGELKLLGYSAYLHPAGAGLLIGIGRDATAAGTDTGLAVSLFDVADPRHPRLLARRTLPGAWQQDDGDHHAFAFSSGLILAPFQRQGLPVPVPAPMPPTDMPAGVPTDTPGGGGVGGFVGPEVSWDAGVLAIRLSGHELGYPAVLRAVASGPLTVGPDRLTTDLMSTAPQRVFVDAGRIYSVSDAGIAVHDAGSLARLSFTRYPPA